MHWVLLVLAVLLVLLILLCWTRVGVWAAFADGALRLDVRIGLLRIHILPAKEKKEKKDKKPKKAKKKKPEKTEGKKGISFTLEDGEDALKTLLPPLKRTLLRIGRGIQIRPLRASLTLGGLNDPSAAALNYGKMQAAVWTGMPEAERLIDIPDPHIHLGMDFQTDKTALEAEAGVSFRIGTVTVIVFGLAVPALRWFLRWRKRGRKRLKEAAAFKKSAPVPEKSV